MSPVITKASSSALLLAAWPVHFTVVSRVFGKAFSKRRERSGSVMIDFIRVMVAST